MWGVSQRGSISPRSTARSMTAAMMPPRPAIDCCRMPEGGRPVALKWSANTKVSTSAISPAHHRWGNPNPSATINAWPMQHPVLAAAAWSAFILAVGIQQPDRLSMIGDLDGAGQGAACRLPDGSVFDRRRHDRGVVSGRRSAAAPKSRADLACGGQPRECLGDGPGGSGGLDHLVDGRLDCLGLAGALVGQV